MPTRADLLLIVALFIMSVLPSWFVLGKSDKIYAQIIVDGVIRKSICLSEHSGYEYFTVYTSNGYNVVGIIDNDVYVIDADCQDKICVKTGHIARNSEIIACLPHKFLIELTNNPPPSK